MFRDYTVGNAIDRQWNWMLCNEPFGYWQEYVFHHSYCIASANRFGSGAPKNRPTIISRLIDSQYWQRQCALFFPTEGKYTYASANGATVERVNKYTKGWDLENTTRLIWTNGYVVRSIPPVTC